MASKNYNDKFYGPTPLRTGIEMSRNLMTIRLAREVGLDIIANYAEKFGVYDDMQEFLANSLGSEETTLYRMVAALRCLQMVVKELCPHWLIGSKIDMVKLYLSTISEYA